MMSHTQPRRANEPILDIWADTSAFPLPLILFILTQSLPRLFGACLNQVERVNLQDHHTQEII